MLAVPSLLLEQFGSNVREIRRSAGLSQEDLAEEAALHRTYIGSIERGERNLSLRGIVELAKALGVDIGRRRKACSVVTGRFRSTQLSAHRETSQSHASARARDVAQMRFAHRRTHDLEIDHSA